jgi:hypothetical protein
MGCLRLIAIFILSIQAVSGQTATNKKYASKSKEPILFRTYGYYDFERQNAKTIVTTTWNIQLVHVAGCLTGSTECSIINLLNRESNNVLSSRYGSDWWDRLNKEIELEYQREVSISDELRKLPFIMRLDSTLDEEKKHTSFSFHPDNKGHYLVVLTDTDYPAIEPNFKVYYELLVDIKTRRLIKKRYIQS